MPTNFEVKYSNPSPLLDSFSCPPPPSRADDPLDTHSIATSVCQHSSKQFDLDDTSYSIHTSNLDHSESGSIKSSKQGLNSCSNSQPPLPISLISTKNDLPHSNEPQLLPTRHPVPMKQVLRRFLSEANMGPVFVKRNKPLKPPKLHVNKIIPQGRSYIHSGLINRPVNNSTDKQSPRLIMPDASAGLDQNSCLRSRSPEPSHLSYHTSSPSLSSSLKLNCPSTPFYVSTFTRQNSTGAIPPSFFVSSDHSNHCLKSQTSALVNQAPVRLSSPARFVRPDPPLKHRKLWPKWLKKEKRKSKTLG
ncbi:unnamed protein product [Protopolystoma xenopodis]|uniref:Uncharacterized protein n=1 Tax=Protopolystoma xenopodis TaxID=117903 RepID=A0A3S5B0F3_9PLAT|nr:unnamed protein product [Protopolystoma xenopodis]